MFVLTAVVEYCNALMLMLLLILLFLLMLLLMLQVLDDEARALVVIEERLEVRHERKDWKLRFEANVNDIMLFVV
jgi:hypothetical protein